MATQENINRQALGSADQIADALSNQTTIVPFVNKKGRKGVRLGNWQRQKGQEAFLMSYYQTPREIKVKTLSKQKAVREAGKKRNESNMRGYRQGDKPVFYHTMKITTHNGKPRTDYSAVHKLMIDKLTSKNEASYFSKLKNKVNHVYETCFSEEKRKENSKQNLEDQKATDDESLVDDQKKLFFAKVQQLKKFLDVSNHDNVKGLIASWAKKPIVDAAQDKKSPVVFAIHESMTPVSLNIETAQDVKQQENERKMVASYFCERHKQEASGKFTPFALPPWVKDENFTEARADLNVAVFWSVFFDQVNGYSKGNLEKTDQDRDSARKAAARKVAEKRILNPTFYLTQTGSGCQSASAGSLDVFATAA